MKAYVQAGLQLDKVVVLTSTYGYLYSLKAGRHREEDVVKSVQKLSNLCVRDILEQENFHTAWDHARMVPYGMVTRDSTRKWITFNDLESHRKKAEFVQKNQLAGIGVFTLDQDIMDDCTGGVPFPFLFTLVKILRPNLAFRMLPKTLGVTGWQGVNQNYANSEDVLVKYIPNDDAPYVGFV